MRVVRVIEMQPDEERPLPATAQPAQRAVGNILRPPFHALVAIFAGLALVKIGVIQVEPTLETGGRRCGIENIGSKERRGVVAASV
jgi:hypothetical protein